MAQDCLRFLQQILFSPERKGWWIPVFIPWCLFIGDAKCHTHCHQGIIMMSRQERITSMALIWEISSNRTGLWWGISGGQAKQLQFNFKHLVTCPILSTLQPVISWLVPFSFLRRNQVWFFSCLSNIWFLVDSNHSLAAPFQQWVV